MPLMVKSSRFLSLVLATAVAIIGVSQLQAQALNLPTQKQDIVAELITLKSQNERLGAEIGSLDSRLNTIDSNLNKLNAEVVDTEFNLNKEMNILAKRARAMYKEGRQHSSLQLLLQSRSIYELITRWDFFELIAKQDIRLIRQSKKDRSRLIRLKSNYISKRQKIVVLKQKREQTITEARTIKAALEKRLQVASKPQMVQVAAGLDSAKFYDGYLTSKRSPMTGLGATLVSAGRQFSVNPDLVVAISGVESTFGRHNAGAFNAWGRKAKGGGYESFASWEEAVFNQTQYLRIKYFNEGRTVPVAIGAKYAPGNGSWPGKVTFFLNDIQSKR